MEINEAGGYIKVFRGIRQSDIWSSKAPFDVRSAWLDLLLLANHKDHYVMDGKKTIKVKRGQVNRSMKWLANEWHWKRDKVKEFLDALQEMGNITYFSDTKGTYINVENYNKWQGRAATDGATKGATDGATVGATKGATVGAHTRKERRERMIENGEKGENEVERVKIDNQSFISGIRQLTPEGSRSLLSDAHQAYKEAKEEGRFKS